MVILYAVTNKYLDDVENEKIVAFEREFFEYMEKSHNNVLTDIREKKVLSEENEKELKEALTQFKKIFEG